MQPSSHHRLIGELWNSIQSWVFPVLEDEIGELDLCPLSRLRPFVSVASMISITEPPDSHFSRCSNFSCRYSGTRPIARVPENRIADGGWKR